MELKYLLLHNFLLIYGSNRTFMELKLAIILREEALLRVLIVPLWN